MSCTDNLVDPQHGRKVHVSNRHGPGISCGTKYCRLLSVRARICHPLQLVSRSATALAKRLSGPHARPGELRDVAIEVLINAGMPVYFVWNRKSHIANGTAKSVGSHSVSNTRCHGISVDDCAKTENLYTAYEAVRGAGSSEKEGRSCCVRQVFRVGLHHKFCFLHSPLQLYAKAVWRQLGGRGRRG